MKFLVLGAKGMLGQELMKVFSADGQILFGLDRKELDIIDEKILTEKINEIQPDVVLNAVANNAVDEIEKTEENFALAKKINGEAVGNLAKICKEKGILLVHYSSDYVFGGENKNGYAEDARLSPVDKYGESKALGEKLLQENTDKYYLIRLSRLFGKPAASAGAKISFVDRMIQLFNEKHQTHFDLVDDEISSPTYAPDLALFTKKLIDSKKSYGIYHGANAGACNWFDFAKKVFELKNMKVDLAPVPGSKFNRPAKRPMFSELLNTKMPTQRSWEEALAEYLR